MIKDSCPICGKVRFVRKHRVGILCRHCAQARCFNKGRFKTKSFHPRWNGGKYIKNGYVFVLSPDHPNKNCHGYIRLHRLLMEKKLGRFLKKTEVVHHVDGNKKNNNIENLYLFDSLSAHGKHHRILQRYGRKLV